MNLFNRYLRRLRRVKWTNKPPLNEVPMTAKTARWTVGSKEYKKMRDG